MSDSLLIILKSFEYLGKKYDFKFDWVGGLKDEPDYRVHVSCNGLTHELEIDADFSFGEDFEEVFVDHGMAELSRIKFNGKIYGFVRCGWSEHENEALLEVIAEHVGELDAAGRRIESEQLEPITWDASDERVKFESSDFPTDDLCKAIIHIISEY
jgi:hypothetical protein